MGQRRLAVQPVARETSHLHGRSIDPKVRMTYHKVCGLLDVRWPICRIGIAKKGPNYDSRRYRALLGMQIH
jgi:hypothetical protein